jgi:transcriptional regulator with XRE-family HTH domain
MADDKQEVIKDLRSTRIELGLSQAEVARSAGISADQVSRIERNLLDLPAIDQLAAHAAVLGMGCGYRCMPRVSRCAMGSRSRG